MDNISLHISYKEATFSPTAVRFGYNNTPNTIQLLNMKLLANNVFELIRNHFSMPIFITSFFRCPELNTHIGGAKNSQHMANFGAAMDIDNDAKNANPTNKVIFNYIKDNLDFDQLIWEYGDSNAPDWVHVSFNQGHNRKQILRCVNGYYIPYK